MRPHPSIIAVVVSSLTPAAFAQSMIADFDWLIDAALITNSQDGGPLPPINLQQGSFFLSSVQVNGTPPPDPTDPVLAYGDAVVGNAGSLTIDISPASDPLWFNSFLFEIQNAGDQEIGEGDIYVNARIDGDLTIHDVGFGQSPEGPQLFDRFDPAESAALATADIAFFRFSIDSLSIVNGTEMGPAWGTFTANGSFEVWTPAPGAAALLSITALPLLRRRR